MLNSFDLVKGLPEVHPDANTLCRLVIGLCEGMGERAVVRDLGRSWEQSMREKRLQKERKKSAGMASSDAGSDEARVRVKRA